MFTSMQTRLSANQSVRTILVILQYLLVEVWQNLSLLWYHFFRIEERSGPPENDTNKNIWRCSQKNYSKDSDEKWQSFVISNTG